MNEQLNLRRHGSSLRHAFNGLVFALVICAVVLGSTAGWMRYTKRRTSGLKDATQQTVGTVVSEISLAAGGLAPNDTAPRYICPQCSSYCWTQSKAGYLMCPFCKQPMVQEIPGIVAAAGLVAGDPMAMPIIPIQVGVKPVHADRGSCTNCHLVIRTATPGLGPTIQAGISRPHRNRGTCTTCHLVIRKNGLGPVPTITAAAVVPHPDRGVCANCHVVAK